MEISLSPRGHAPLVAELSMNRAEGRSYPEQGRSPCSQKPVTFYQQPIRQMIEAF